MDITYIDGTGHGMTFYDSDDNDDGSRFSMAEERENFIYNGDFSKINSGANDEEHFSAWTAQNLDRIDGYDYENGAWLKTRIKVPGSSSELPGDLIGIRQTSAELPDTIHNYEFAPGKEFTLSFSAKKDIADGKIAPVYYTSGNSGTLQNSLFIYNESHWDFDDGENSYDSHLEASSLLTEKRWAMLRGQDNSISQVLPKRTFIFQPDKRLCISFLVKTSGFVEEYDYGVLTAEIAGLNDDGERTSLASVPMYIPVSTSSSESSVEHWMFPDLGDLVQSEEFNTYELIITRTDNGYADSSSEIPEGGIIFITAINLTYGDSPSEWYPSLPELLLTPEDDTSNLLVNGDFSKGSINNWYRYSINMTLDGQTSVYDGDPEDFFVSDNYVALVQPLRYLPQGPMSNYKVCIWYRSNITMTGAYAVFSGLAQPSGGGYGDDVEETLISIPITPLPNTNGELSCVVLTTSSSTSFPSNTKSGLFYFMTVRGTMADDSYLHLEKIEVVKETVDTDGEIIWQPSGFDDYLDDPEKYVFGLGSDSYDDLRVMFRGIQNGTALPFESKQIQLTSARTRYVTNYTFSSNIDGFELYFGTPQNSSLCAVITDVQLEQGLEASTFHPSNYERQIITKANTWRDWHIVPSSRPVFNPPSPKYVFIDVPGSNNKLDLTGAVSKYVKYDSREGDFEFIVDPQYRWMDIYEKVLNYLHGQELDCILDDDPEYYYHGRFSVDKWKSDQKRSTITLKYTVDAYKYEKYLSTDNWLWDPFSFETGVVRDYGGIDVINYAKMYINVSEMPVIPQFVVSGLEPGKTLTVKFQNKSYSLKNGNQHVAQIEFGPFSENLLEFYGTATVSIKFKGGKL